MDGWMLDGWKARNMNASLPVHPHCTSMQKNEGPHPRMDVKDLTQRNLTPLIMMNALWDDSIWTAVFFHSNRSHINFDEKTLLISAENAH